MKISELAHDLNDQFFLNLKKSIESEQKPRYELQEKLRRSINNLKGEIFKKIDWYENICYVDPNEQDDMTSSEIRDMFAKHGGKDYVALRVKDECMRKTAYDLNIENDDHHVIEFDLEPQDNELLKQFKIAFKKGLEQSIYAN